MNGSDDTQQLSLLHGACKQLQEAARYCKGQGSVCQPINPVMLSMSRLLC